MVDPTNLAEVADIVNRKKISDRRLRNEEIRRAQTDPTSFQADYAPQIAQAQQPQEFWGAGRKLAQNQNPDVEAANIFGHLSKLGGEYYYYGNDDVSDAQLGTKGYNTRDLGLGKYEILGQDNNVLGTGYKSLSDTIGDYARRNARQYADYRKRYEAEAANLADLASRNDYYVGVKPNISDAPWWMQRGHEGYWQGDTGVEPQRYDESYVNDMILRATADPSEFRPGGLFWDKSDRSHDTRSDLARWETLGQLIHGSQGGVGKFGGIIDPVTSIQATAPGSRIGSPSNKLADLISGENALFGSTPVIRNGKVVGYKMDLTPGQGENPLVDQYQLQNKKEAASGYVGRNYKDLDTWKSLIKNLDDTGSAFVSAENATKLPGWENVDDWQYQRAASEGGLSSFLGKISPILKFTPFAPFGYFIDMARGVQSGNYGTAAMSALGGLGSMGQGPNLGGSVNKGLGLDEASKIGKAIAAGGTAAAGALIDKKSLSDALKSGAISGLGNLVNAGVTGALKEDLGDILSKMTGGAASSGLKSLFTKDAPVRGSLYGNMGGGLHSYLNTLPASGGSFETQPTNKLSSKNLKSIFNRRT